MVYLYFRGLDSIRNNDTGEEKVYSRRYLHDIGKAGYGFVFLRDTGDIEGEIKGEIE